MLKEQIVVGGNTCVHRIRDGGFCDDCTERDLARAQGLCVNCRRRPSDGTWVGEGGVLAWVHGYGDPWCNLCMRRAQLKGAEEAAARVESLRAEVLALESATKRTAR